MRLSSHSDCVYILQLAIPTVQMNGSVDLGDILWGNLDGTLLGRYMFTLNTECLKLGVYIYYKYIVSFQEVSKELVLLLCFSIWSQKLIV